MFALLSYQFNINCPEESVQHLYMTARASYAIFFDTP